MKFFAFIILLGFISLSLFGFTGMLTTYDMGHVQNRCLASLAQNGACPPEDNTVASAIFHTSAFKVFSTTMLSLGALLLALAFLFYFFVPLIRSARLGVRTLSERIAFVVLCYLGIARLRTALARLETSPTL